ncbi:VOC family protein [Kitasatospora sp. CB01950]|uniref:VOC family protein n=1 Tax=Kitasatospora sp. CB01950 TaxID=1703930 RepID=UPI001F51A1B7|nr:VOC family protein [Kitasatospora sp. CB01950]
MTEQQTMGHRPIGALSSTVLDCPDPERLAAFYRRLTGWQVTYRSEAYVFIGDGPVRIGFQRVGGFRPPVWPSDGARAHLDFTVPELGPAVAELLAAGATKPEHQAGGDHWVTLLDPDGHPFCLAVPE